MSLKESIKPVYHLIHVDWVQDGNIHTRLFHSETYTTVFDQAWDFAAFISDSLHIPIEEIVVAEPTSVGALS